MVQQVLRSSVPLSKTLTTIHFNQEDQNAAHFMCNHEKKSCVVVFRWRFPIYQVLNAQAPF